MKYVLFPESFVSGVKRSDSQLKGLLRAYCLLFYIPPASVMEARIMSGRSSSKHFRCGLDKFVPESPLGSDHFGLAWVIF